MSPVYGKRVRFPGYSLELTGRGEILFYRRWLRRAEAAVAWVQGEAHLYPDSIKRWEGFLPRAIRPAERAVIVDGMAAFLGDNGLTRVYVRSNGLDREGKSIAPGA